MQDGVAAWRALQRNDAPPLAVLNWLMPGMDGVEVCRRVRGISTSQPTYIILLTALEDKKDIVAGLRAGADDYVTKPFDLDELRARVQAGERMVGLQSDLAGRLKELEDALSQVKQLSGLLPICAYCKKIRDDHNYWRDVEQYVSENSEARFSHSMCPGCRERHFGPPTEEVRERL